MHLELVSILELPVIKTQISYLGRFYISSTNIGRGKRFDYYLAETVVVKEAQSSVTVSGVEPVTSSHTARAWPPMMLHSRRKLDVDGFSVPPCHTRYFTYYRTMGYKLATT